MHQYASECIKMHQNVYRMNCSDVLCMKFKFEKFQFFGQKKPNFFLSAQNASICIGMHQNVCRMNCANVLCTKLSKKCFLLDLNRIKLKNYLYHFVMEDPVSTRQSCWQPYLGGISIWTKEDNIPTSSFTHPKMFHYLGSIYLKFSLYFPLVFPISIK